MLDVFPLSYTSQDLASYAADLVQTFHFVLDNQHLPRLNLTDERLELLSLNFSPLFVDLNRKSWQRRSQAGKQQGLVRVCKPMPGLKILDATAGWGKDAAILATYGAEVTMLERQPIMAALLSDALKRSAKEVNPLSLRLVFTDACTYLRRLTSNAYPDIIYIDPMHPERTKSALVKKDMQIMQSLFGPDKDADTLITLAKERVKRRVIVKWPQQLPALQTPTLSLQGKTVRFDIYIPARQE